MPTNKDFTKNMADKLADTGEIELEAPPSDYDFAADEAIAKAAEEGKPKPRSFRPGGGFVNKGPQDRLQNESVKLLEQRAAIGKKGGRPRPEARFSSEELPEPMSPEEMTARTAQAKASVAKDEASGIIAVRNRRKAWAAEVQSKLAKGEKPSPSGLDLPPAPTANVESRQSRSLRAKAEKDLLSHSRVQAKIRESMAEFKTLKQPAPKFMIRKLQEPAPSIPAPKYTRTSGDLGPKQETPAIKITPAKNVTPELGNLETKTVYPPINRDLSRVFNEPYTGEVPRHIRSGAESDLHKERLKLVGKSLAEPKDLETVLKAVNAASPKERAHLGRLIDKGTSQSSIDTMLLHTIKPPPPTSATGEIELDLTPAGESVKRYTETVAKAPKPELTAETMQSGLAEKLPGAAKLAGKAGKVEEIALEGSKVAQAVRGAAKVSTTTSKLADLLKLATKGGKAGIAALMIGAGMAGIKNIGDKLRE